MSGWLLLSTRQGTAPIFFVLAILFFVDSDLVAGGLEIGEPTLRILGPEVYGGHLQVWAVAEDSRGVIYFGTTRELMEFDGINWRRVNFPLGKAVYAIELGPDGVVYVAGSQELGYLAVDLDGQVVYRSLVGQVPAGHAPKEKILTIVPTTHGIYFISKLKTYRWHQGKLEIVPIGAHSPIGINDTIYLASADGFALISNGKVVHPPSTPFPIEQYGRVYLLESFDDQSAILYTEKQGLFWIRPSGQDLTKTALKTTKFDNEANDYIIQSDAYSAARLGDRAIAICTLTGGIVILSIDGKLLRIVNKNRGMPSDSVYDIHTDKFGNLWAAYQGGVVYVHTSSPLSLFSKQSGINSTVLAVTRHQGSIYAGTFLFGVSRLPDYVLNTKDDSHRFELIDGIPRQTAWGFLSSGSVLLVAADVGQIISDGKAVLLDDAKSVSPYDVCRSKRFKNRFYLGLSDNSQGGLGVLERIESDQPADVDRTFVYHGKLPGIDETIRKCHETPNGDLWLASEQSGILQVKFKSSALDDIEVIRFTTDHGLPTNRRNNLSVDGDRILLATQKKIYVEQTEHTEHGSNESFAPATKMNAAFGAIDEPMDDIRKLGPQRWLVSPVGVYGILTQQSDGRYKADSRPFRSISNDQGRVHVDPDGVAWMPAKAGLFRYDPNVKKDYEAPFTTLIREVKTNSERVLFLGNNVDEDSRIGEHYRQLSIDQPATSIPQLPYAENGLGFQYSALFFEYSERTEYETKLEGFDDRWSGWSSSTFREYTNLPEGSYAFKVRAKNCYDTQSREAIYRFVILPPWYRTIWAFIAYVLSFAASIFVSVKLYVRRLERAKRKLEATVKERTLELEIAYQEVNHAKNALWGEMQLAKKIQTVLLPKNPIIPGYEITGYMQTADSVGGDYYDVIRTKNKYWLAIGDVSGHGVSAGLVMMMAQTALNHALTALEDKTPDQIIASVNQVLYDNIQKLGESKYMTFMLLAIGSDGTIHYSGLHQDVLVFRKAKKAVDTVETQGMWLGVVPEIDQLNSVNHLHLSEGDVMLLTTDGIIEAKDDAGQMYGTDRLRTELENHGQLSTEALRDRILKSTAGYEHNDDVTLIIVKRDSE